MKFNHASRYYVGLALLTISAVVAYGAVLSLLFMLNRWAFLVVLTFTVTAGTGFYLMDTGHRMPDYTKEVEQFLNERPR